MSRSQQEWQEERGRLKYISFISEFPLTIIVAIFRGIRRERPGV